MSHFTCLVIGEDVDGQLEPYDENTSVPRYKTYWDSDTLSMWERTLQEPTHVRRDPETKEETEAPYPPEQILAAEWTLEDMRRVYMARYHGFEYSDEDKKFVEEDLDGFEVDESALDERLHIDDGGLYEWSTYNPKSKWDWYQIGGRWSGFFKLKEHALAGATLGDSGTFDNPPTHDSDQARKGDVDIDWMREQAASAAADRWDRVHAVIRHFPKVKSWEEFADELTLAERLGETSSIEDARKTYHAQEAVVVLKAWNDAQPDEQKVMSWFGPTVEDFQVPRDEYIAAAVGEVLCPYAYLVDGEWHAPGKMGWFGQSSDTKSDRRRFVREFNELLDSLPDDTLLTLCDLHI